MASTARIDELKKKFDENPRRYFAPLANEFRKAGDIEQAIVICEEFLPQQPGHMSGHIVYGQALFEAGKLPESRAVFETALGLDPENLIALRHLGDIARDQGDHPAARGWYARVLDADPRNEEIQAVISNLDSVTVTAPMDVVVPEPSSPFAPPPIPPADAAAPATDAIHAPPELLDLENFGAPPPLPVEPLLEDTHPLGVPVIPAAPHYTPSSANTAIIEGFSAHSFEQQPETESLMPAASEMAHGLESTAFTPPNEPVESASDLDSSLESGVPSFAAPERPVPSLEGLQGHTENAHGEGASLEHLPPLDLDDGLVLPPQGDPVAPPAQAERETPPSMSSIADDFEEFEIPGGEEPAAVSAPEARVEDEEGVPSPAYESIPTELPPSVIAAEAELIDAGESPAPTPAPELEMALDDEPHAPAPFVTETMAELYLAQGFRERAHEVYVQLSAASPSNERLRGLAASLAEPAPASAAPTVRDFFARLAARRPANRAAAVVPPAADDFAPIDPLSGATEPPDEVPYSVAEAEEIETVESAAPDWHADPLPSTAIAEEAFTLAEEEPEPEPFEAQEPVAPALERSAKMRTPNGSIDALFGNRVPGTSEDSAAAALAQAFGGVTEGPLPTIGRPAHAASGELSLDSVFRDGPARAPRPSQSFSFDQFFTGSSSASDRASGTPSRPSGELAVPGEPPAEKSPEDIEQFNSWLQGLKQR